MPPAPHPPDNPRYLITGAKGFIGAWIVKNLVERGERPWIFDQDPACHRLEAILSREAFEMVHFVRGDVTDFEALDRAVADLGISRLIHLAALQVPLCAADPRRGAEVNVVGTLNVFGWRAGEKTRSAGLFTPVPPRSSAPRNFTAAGAFPRALRFFPARITG